MVYVLILIWFLLASTVLFITKKDNGMFNPLFCSRTPQLPRYLDPHKVHTYSKEASHMFRDTILQFLKSGQSRLHITLCGENKFRYDHIHKVWFYGKYYGWLFTRSPKTVKVNFANAVEITRWAGTGKCSLIYFKAKWTDCQAIFLERLLGKKEVNDREITKGKDTNYCMGIWRQGIQSQSTL